MLGMPSPANPMELVVVGTSRDARTPGASFFDEALSLVRYNVNGTLDTSLVTEEKFSSLP